MTVLSSLIAFSCAAIVLTPSIMSYASGTRWRRRNSTEANLAPQSFDENAVEEVLQRTRGTQRTADRKRWSTFEVVQLVRETANDVSVYMMPIDGKVPPTYRAGQHTMILRPAMGNLPAAQRCYTLSLAPGLGVWRITVRDAKATRDTNSVSRWVCNELKVGDRLSVRNPGGVFTLDLASDTKPLVLIGAGIGITPMSSMIQHELMFDRKRPKWLFHQVRDPASSPLTGEI